MKKLKPFLHGAIAVVAAMLVSIFLREQSLVFLSCLAVVPIALAVAAVRCAIKRFPQDRGCEARRIQ